MGSMIIGGLILLLGPVIAITGVILGIAVGLILIYSILAAIFT